MTIAEDKIESSWK